MAHERRIARIASRIREEVAELFLRDLKDPRMKGLTSIPRVMVARDLGHARVLYTVLGSANDRSTVSKFIKSAQPFVQRAIAQSLKLRVAPIVEFTYDDSIEKQAAVSKLIEGALAQDRAAAKAAKTKASDEEE
jgi:ribosome-binding factor A